MNWIPFDWSKLEIGKKYLFWFDNDIGDDFYETTIVGKLENKTTIHCIYSDYDELYSFGDIGLPTHFIEITSP